VRLMVASLASSAVRQSIDAGAVEVDVEVGHVGEPLAGGRCQRVMTIIRARWACQNRATQKMSEDCTAIQRPTRAII
jgi:hypothetical protein